MSSECWSSTLQRLLKPYRDPAFLRYDSLNPRSSRHPSGVIWKKCLIECILADLYLLESTSTSVHEDDNGEDSLGSLPPRREKRFVRMEEMGLGAIITFEIPHPSRAGRAQSLRLESQQALSVESTMSRIEENQAAAEWTLRSVFGDPDDPSLLGMEIDDLFDKINAKVSYVPLYACTSFAIGQAMNALLRNTDTEALDMRPRPSTLGFSVDSQAFTLLDCPLPSFAKTNLETRSSSFPSQQLSSESAECEKPVKDLQSQYLRSTPEPAPRFRADRLKAFPQLDSRPSRLGGTRARSSAEDYMERMMPDTGDTMLPDQPDRDQSGVGLGDEFEEEDTPGLSISLSSESDTNDLSLEMQICFDFAEGGEGDGPEISLFGAGASSKSLFECGGGEKAERLRCFGHEAVLGDHTNNRGSLDMNPIGSGVIVGKENWIQA